MKKINLQKIAVSAAIVLSAFTVKAQTDTAKKQATNPFNRFAIGYSLSQYKNDFGVGLSLTSPYIGKFLAFRLLSNMQWLDNTPKDEVKPMWSTYYNFRLGVVTRQFIVNEKISIYSEGGIIAILPNMKTSSSSLNLGGYGVFGFEFHPSPYSGFTQFIEAGGIGTNAVADKSIGNPIYCNGFMLAVGFRIHLR